MKDASAEEKVGEEIRDCKAMALSACEVVAERVAMRLVAKLSRLFHKEHREAAFADVDEIIADELKVMEAAMDDQLKSVSK